MSSTEVKVEVNQYLTFTLGSEKYGINIMNTKEVLESSHLTKVPRMPDFMKGIINLRGSVVPVIDLKVKFGMNEEDTETTSVTTNNNIIVTEVDDIENPEEKLTIGIYTDAVHKVLTIEGNEIEAAPKIGIPIHTDFIYGMGKIDEEFIILLNINKIINAKDLQLLKSETPDSVEDKDE